MNLVLTHPMQISGTIFYCPECGRKVILLPDGSLEILIVGNQEAYHLGADWKLTMKAEIKEENHE